MTVWVVLAAVIGVGLLAVVVIGARRPRSAEDELGKPKARPAPNDTDSSDTMDELKPVLQRIQAGKETGTLVVVTNLTRRVGCVYFLYGHVFHAVYGAATGEAALREMLGWPYVECEFDRNAPLPKEETIDRPLDEILAA